MSEKASVFPTLEGAQSLENAYAIGMQKGGVGKTLTAVNVTGAAARAGKKVLMVDLDPQASLTKYFKHLLAGKPLKDTMYHLLVEGRYIQPTRLNKLISLLPANVDLAAFNQLVTILPTTKEKPNKVLARCLTPYAAQFDLIFIDCPPSLEPLTMNGLTAAKSVIIPVSTEEMAEDALPLITSSIRAIRTNTQLGANPTLKVQCILPTLYNTRGNSSPEVLQSIKDEYGADYYIYPYPTIRKEAYQKAVKRSLDVGAIDGELKVYWDTFFNSMILQESQAA